MAERLLDGRWSWSRGRAWAGRASAERLAALLRVAVPDGGKRAGGVWRGDDAHGDGGGIGEAFGVRPCRPGRSNRGDEVERVFET
jgi:hypothetical protein